MCGLAGFLSQRAPDDAARILGRMGDSLSHRGPDNYGEFLDPEAGVGFAHRRLAIIDLSPAGNQPMVSASGRFVISLNGEFYNHPQLRSELEAEGKAPNWKSSSDIETLLAGFDAWGVMRTLRRAVGMFAFSLWDRKERALLLSRDRLGEKPIYYGWQGSGSGRAFLFGSELKALACHPAFEGEIDRDALAAFMRHGFVPTPQSIYRGVSKLPPGTVLTLSAGSDEPRIEPYWSASEAVRDGLVDPLRIGEAEAVDRLEQLLGQAVAGQLIGDVPVGAFLSGGIDSSAIVALMQRHCSSPVRTFTIGFDDARFDEAPFARAVAAHLGTDHDELYVSAKDALAVVPRLPRMYDEPFADSSQIPTFLVSELARTKVTVALSGDGGDELFAGYERYLHAARLWPYVKSVPRPLRAAAAEALGAVPASLWNGFGSVAGTAGFSPMADRVGRGASVLASRSAPDMAQRFAQRWDGYELVIGAAGPVAPGATHSADAVESLMELDLRHYLPDDILAKVDRAAMAVSLETRAPFLDHRVVEFAWRLPLELKLRSRETKWILRRLLARHVPDSLIDRPKRGFSVPVDEWLRGPLKAWAEELLDPSRLREQGYVRSEPVRRAWEAHLSGRSNRQAQLWTVLMFQAWMEEWGGKAQLPGVEQRAATA